MPLNEFHPVITRWFQGRFSAPTLPQSRGWPRIIAGEHTLIAAPTGSGKTLTAFLAAIDRLLKLSLTGELTEEIRVVYISPLRALSNDMHRNLEVPLAEIAALAESEGLTMPPIRAGLRTGDTSASQRAALLKHPPHILVTTPESLYLLLGSVRGREALRRVETVIVDEIHALVRDKRGSHLALSLERLAALTEAPLQRIGLSATQRPIDEIARFLVGADESSTCSIVDAGHQRDLDLAIEVPPSDLGAVCMHEQWAEVNARIGELIHAHRSTLIFVNTRRMAERLTHQLTELLGEDVVSSHHGSLAADHRLSTERRLKNGTLKAVVATASLELGLDIGYIDLVIQIGSPRSIATFLQRVGRSGHALGLVPKGRLFALTRDELMECMALIRAVRSGRLDVVQIPTAPLDILAQQIVAEVASREWGTDELFALCRRAYSYRDLTRSAFDQVLQLLSEGITHSAGRGRVYLHHDQVGRRVRARPGARIAAATSGGAIPEIASYRVVAEPEHTVVGTLDEDFASESQAGEIFLLGNTSWRIQYVRGGDVTVTDAEAPRRRSHSGVEKPRDGRELSAEVSSLREELERRIADPAAAASWLVDETCVTAAAAAQMVTYAAAQQGAIGLLPTQRKVVFERFFDESGGMQLVVHAPFGARITKAWGLALRKRFCRSFDFELQATADDDGLVLSLGPQHSFPLESMFGMLTEQNFQRLLEQALLAVPTFQTRWRWNVTRALLVLRQKNGKKVPPALQRFRADDLLTAVFPKLTGCQENVTGDLELPDHPLVTQSMHDSLSEAHDVEGLRSVLGAIDRGEITLIARDTREPSPFCYELLNADPYAFLDGGEIAERRTRAVATRRSLTVESVSDLGRLDPEAIARVRAEAQPLVRTADELHDVLLSRIALPVSEGTEWTSLFEKLCAERRGATLSRPGVEPAWIPAERLPAVTAAFPDALQLGQIVPVLSAPAGVRQDWTAEEVRVALARGLMEICGPITSGVLSQRIGMTPGQADAALEALEGEGVVLRGRFTPEAYVPVRGLTPSGSPDEAIGEPEGVSPRTDSDVATTEQVEWCHRRLLSRIHRLTMEGLRKQIEPVGVDVFLRFLTRHHGLYVPAIDKEPNSSMERGGGYAVQRTGPSGVAEVVSMLQGLDLPAVVWERDLLPGRIARYRPEWLDELCLAGEVAWGRLFPKRRLPDRSRPMSGLTRVVPLSLFQRAASRWLQAESQPGDPASLSSPASQVQELLKTHGAMFAADLLAETGMLPAQMSEALGELVSQGFVTADGFAGLRKLIAERSGVRDNQRLKRQQASRRRVPLSGAGRWSLWRRHTPQNASETPASERTQVVEEWAWLLLRRWGVVFRDLLEREDGAPRWFELLQVLRRLEARGEIRGGRFITGVAGEQFALGDTVRTLRQLRDTGPQGELVVISAADPLNLVGVLTNHDRVTRNASNRIAYQDGQPVAALVAGDVQYLVEPTPELRARLEEGRLLRTHGRAREEQDDDGTDSKNGRSQSNGDAAKRRNQKSLFPKRIPGPS